MRSRWNIIAAGCLWMAGANAWAQAPARPTTAARAPVTTRQSAFTIPFNVPPPRDPAHQPVEVQLHVSADQGKTWEIANKQTPTAGRFEFRAPQDGEFWFTSRTVDRAGRAHPDGPLTAELKVVIDTASPRLDLFAEVGPAGEVTTNWEVSDAHLVLASFKMFFRYAETDEWKPVAIDLPKDAGGRTTINGHTTWWAEAQGQPLEIRAEVHDSAGNQNVVHRQLELPRVARRDTYAQSFSPPVPAPRPEDVAVNNNLRTNLPPTTPFSPVSTGPQPAPGGAAAPVAPAETAVARPEPTAQQRVYSTPPVPGGAQPINWPVDHIFGPVGPGGARTFGPSVETRVTQNNNGPIDLQQSPRYNTGRPTFAPVSDPVSRQSSGPAINGPSEKSDALELPPGEQPRMTRARRFNLDYDVEGVGPSGVAKVELWATRNGGRLWERWGVDDDRRSPFPIEVEAEGIYGFRIVIYSGNGLSGRPPYSGDPAEVWVGVDATQPNARITAAKYGEGDQVGILTINWEASDVQLGLRPVTLLFSDRADGPWTTVAAGLPNSGKYDWQVDGRVPQYIYLRLEVRDEAGNVAVHVLERPVANDGLVPRGRIRSIQPLGEENSSAYRGQAWR